MNSQIKNYQAYKVFKRIVLASFIFIFIFSFFTPNLVSAEEKICAAGKCDDAYRNKESWIPCGNDLDADNKPKNPCEFDHFLIMVNRVIDFMLFQLALPLTALSFAWAGFLLLFSGGNTSKRDQAKKIFTNTALGLVIAFGCWLAVHTVLSILEYDGSWIGF